MEAGRRGAQGAAKGSDGDALTAIFTGLGSLSYGEMAGERMKLGLLLHDPEEEHDCFSDNTHNSHYYDVVGIENVYLGRYKRTDGSVVSGASVSDLVKAKAPEIDERVRKALAETDATQVGALKTRAETVEAYDQMIGEGNKEGNAVVEAVDRGAHRADPGIRARDRGARIEGDQVRRFGQSRQPGKALRGKKK